eukprot:14364108-Alexandrium_andersonii.AAC.1
MNRKVSGTHCEPPQVKLISRSSPQNTVRSSSEFNGDLFGNHFESGFGNSANCIGTSSEHSRNTLGTLSKEQSQKCPQPCTSGNDPDGVPIGTMGFARHRNRFGTGWWR